MLLVVRIPLIKSKSLRFESAFIWMYVSHLVCIMYIAPWQVTIQMKKHPFPAINNEVFTYISFRFFFSGFSLSFLTSSLTCLTFCLVEGTFRISRSQGHSSGRNEQVCRLLRGHTRSNYRSDLWLRALSKVHFWLRVRLWNRLTYNRWLPSIMRLSSRNPLAFASFRA